jgi:predicted enzyme related to lactoylglutathione lyase
VAILLAALVATACRFERADPPPRMGQPQAGDSVTTSTRHLLGLRTAKYTAPDLAAAKAWYSEVTGVAPYFDEPFYVGFNIGGFELGIVPDDSAAASRAESGVAYWGVTNADSAYARLVAMGATEHEPIQDVGEGIRIGSVHDPFGNVLGVIENPHFRPE